MSKNIEHVFARLQKKHVPAFMPFFVAGFPNFKTSVNLISLAAKHAHVIEIGVPYSDPLADGPTIQAANSVALRLGMNTKRTFLLIQELRKSGIKTPIVLMLYANLVERMGVDTFFKKAARVGVDGVLIPDVPFEESIPFRASARRHGISYIQLISLTTSKNRMHDIGTAGEGFLYLVSVLGTTGGRREVSSECIGFLKRIKKQNVRLPICVGFGISSRRHIHELTRAGAYGYIVGSALVKFIQRNAGKQNLVLRFDQYLRRFVLIDGKVTKKQG